MADGKYGAVSGLIGRMQMMDNISEQLASDRVRSYKRGVATFEAELAEANSGMATKGLNFTRVKDEIIDFSPGQLEYTGDPLQVAIDGDGFFQVQQADGSFGYTRKGLFKLNGEGMLTDANGQLVMNAGGGPIPLATSDVEISPDGKIWQDSAQVGQLGIFQFADNSILSRSQGDMFLPKDGSQPALHPDPKLVQKNLETSNVNMMQTMVQMTTNLRIFESMQKALRIYSDMDSKAAELGTVQ